MVDNLVMFRVNIHELKARLSELLDKLEVGEALLVCRRNVPIAELRRLPPDRPRRRKRTLGKAKGQLTVPASFFEPLPDHAIDGFEGRSGLQVPRILA